MVFAVFQKAPQKAGPYDLLQKLGQGGTGSVYKGRSRETGQVVAVKLLPAKLLGNPVLRKRFEQEFQVLRRLEHPGLVRGLDFGEDDGVPYLVMEFVEGRSLHDVIDARGRLPETEAVTLLTAAAGALDYMHRQGAIHRDVKPDNILVAADGAVKLTDFGLVKEAGGGIELTRTNAGLGTPHFMAPEQFDDAKNVDARCDVYSLGATLYVAVTGKLPFDGSNYLHVLTKKLRNELHPPREFAPALSERAERAILRSMHPERDRRTASCTEFIAELTGAGPAPAVAAAPVKVAPGRERRATVRFASRRQGRCRAVGGDADQPWAARVLDISAGGMGLILTRRFEPGTTLTVQFAGADAGQPQRLLVRVVRVKRRSDGKWQHGCSFGRRLSADEVDALQ